MSALAFDFDVRELPPPETAAGRAALASRGELAPAPRVRRHLYAVRGTVVDAPRHAPTLDTLLGSAFSKLATGFAACPVCHEETMTARWTAGHGVAGGRCASCGTILE